MQKQSSMTAEERLKKFGLKVTEVRVGIVDCLQNHKGAISDKMLTSMVPVLTDRTTKYRNLKKLEETGLIHKVTVHGTETRYALTDISTSKCSHPHFYCNSCKRVECLTTYEVPKISLPQGYLMQEAETILRGICNECAI